MIGDGYLRMIADDVLEYSVTNDGPNPQTITSMAKELLIARKIIANLKKPTTAEVRRQLLVDYDILTSR